MDQPTTIKGAGPQSHQANRLLKHSAQFWFVIALLGQWAFVYYIAAHYGGSAIQGNLEAWGKSSIKGYVGGDISGNLFFAAHVLLAATITLGGTLQLIPYIRKHAITFHRWNGRFYILSAFVISLAGLYLIWVRDASTTLIGSVAITINALLIMLFALLTLKHARARTISTHRRWALRVFLAVNGVWFFRIGLMGWIVINQGPVGVGENLDGPFVVFLNFANYLLPLAVLELYLLAQVKGGTTAKILMSLGLVLLTILMGVGIFAAFSFMWLPFM